MSAQTPTTQSGDGQYVENGSFERFSGGGEVPPAWFQNLSRTGGKGQIVQVEDYVFSGQGAIRISPNQNNDSNLPLSLAQEIDATELRGKEVVFSGRMATEGGAKALIGLMHEAGGKQSEFTIIFQPDTGGDWAYQERTYFVPDEPEVKLYLSIWVPDQGGSAWFDDVSVRLNGDSSERPAGISPAPADQVALTRPSNAAASTGAERNASDVVALDAEVIVDANRVVRAIPRTLFGANIEWRWDATSLWQAQERRIDPQGLRLADEMGISLIRYPGGIYSDFYHWRDGIGPYAERPEVRHEPGKEDRSRPNFGTDEALQMADDIGAELLITVNITTGTAKEAADWVRYVNKDELRVRFWEIGNEQYIKTNTPVSQAATMTPARYAEKVREFSAAMKAADSRISIGVIGGLNEGSYRQMGYENWNEIVLGAVGDHADFLSVHNAYAPILTGDEKGKDLRAVYRAMLGRPQAISRNLARLSAQLDELYPPGSARPFIAVSEWGPLFQFFHAGAYVDHPKTLGSALFAASTLKAFIESDSTEMAAFWMLNDYSVLGWIGSANDDFPPDPDWIPTARYHAFQLFSKYFGSALVASTTRSPTFDTEQVGWSDAESDVPYLDVVASLSEDGGRLYVLAINKHFTAPIRTQVDLRGFEPHDAAERWVLSGTGIDAHTGTKVIKVPGLVWGTQAKDGNESRFEYGANEEIRMENTTVGDFASSFSYTFPAHSITSLILTRQ